MENATYIALSRQTALRRELAVVANNIANTNTNAFKRELGVYNSFASDAQMTEKLDFVIDRGTVFSFEPGLYKPTDNPFDLAITGPGFFVVDDGQKELFTRNGAFSVDSENRLVTRTGEVVLDVDSQPLFIPPGTTRVDIAEDGTVSDGPEIIGRVRLVEFENIQGLQKRGRNLYETTERPKPAENSKVVQGQLESSNVNSISEMTRMIEIQRSYEAVKGFLDREQERLRTAVQRLGRPNAV